VSRTIAQPAALFDWLAKQPDIRVVRRLRQVQAPGVPACPEIAVVEMESERAVALRSSVEVLVEPDLPLSYADPNPIVSPFALPDPGVVVPLSDALSVPFVVRDADGAPLDGADVCLFGHSWQVQGRTGPDGRVVLRLTVDTPDTSRALYVRPAHGHWSLWAQRPALRVDADNVVVVKRLSETFAQFPQRQVAGWGHGAMGLDRIPPTYRAHGVRIAIIDSGVDVNHPDLRDRVAAGVDVIAGNDSTWRTDTAGHGSSCAGIIAGVDDGVGVVGIAVDAEVHACKIFPGGRFSDLIEALDYCVECEIDIAHCSLGSPYSSDLVALKILDACDAGVACIAPAGNSGGAVTFPGNLPTVLTVSALGRLGEFPPGSYQATEVPGWTSPEGYFSPSFTCFGPEVNVCAPGVAIPSLVPPDSYTVRDGTGVAAAHVTGVAALVLAHHDGFREWFRLRNAARVGHLFQIISASCRPVGIADGNRCGAGLPDAPRALGLVPLGAQPLLSAYA
jgi:subtilisin family serine protease